jgi:hypothetical protein
LRDTDGSRHPRTCTVKWQDDDKSGNWVLK